MCDKVPAHMTDNKTSVKDMFLRGIAVLGLIAVLLLGAWGIIQIAMHVPSFVAGVGSSITSLFNREEPPTATTTPTVTPSTQTPATAGKPTTTYVTAGNLPAQAGRTNLWGYPDLAIRILSVNSLSSIQGRTVIQFEVVNTGSNVAGKGWSFDAVLPIGGSYTTSSGGQQALYPGDKIVYTLAFDARDYRNNWDDRDCDWDERRDRWECDDDRNDRNSRNTKRNVTIVVDPYNVVWETNERNNSIRVNL